MKVNRALSQQQLDKEVARLSAWAKQLVARAQATETKIIAIEQLCRTQQHPLANKILAIIDGRLQS